MATWINTLTPAKNSTDIEVDAEVFIDVESDDLLDPRTVQFFINNVEVKPSSRYSIQSNLVNKRRLNITFFPKRRIKFANKRYGQDDTRYGQTDIVPSNFWYGSTYACRIVVPDSAGGVFEDSFSFTIEEGVSFSNNTNPNYYTTVSQELGNYFPEWTKARYNKYSNFQQMVNPMAKILRDMDKKISEEFSNYFVQLANYNEMSLTYKASVGGDIEFQTTTLSDGSRLSIPPEVRAMSLITNFYPTPEYNNNVKDFYYAKLPDRIDESKITLATNIIKEETLIGTQKQYIRTNLDRKGVFTIRTQGGYTYAKLNNTGDLLKVMALRVVGKSLYDTDQSETLLIIDNDHYSTKKRWAYIDYVQFIDIPENFNGTYTLQYLQENEGVQQDSFRFISAEDFNKPVFWGLGSNDYGSVLVQEVVLKDSIDDIIATVGQKTEVSEYELLDVDGLTQLTLKDITVDTFSDFLYGIDDDYLYIYNKQEEYASNVKQIPPGSGNTDFVIDISDDQLARQGATKEVEISGNQIVPGKEIYQYVFYLVTPSGQTQYITAEGNLVATELEAQVLPKRGQLQILTKPITVELTEIGDYMFCAKASYNQGSPEIDGKIVSIKGKAALAKYKMGRLLQGSPVRFMSFDYDGIVKVYDENNFLHSLRFAKDNMLIDYENFEVYFNENYEEVEIDA